MTRWALGLFALLAAFHGSRLTPLHGWSDDGAMYLRHAMNLIEGRDYTDALHGATRSVTTAPGNYPPVLPALLAPLVRLGGLDFLLFKIAMLAIFLAALAALLLPLRMLVSPWQALGIVAVLGFNPTLALIAAHINSDFLFLLILAVALWWLDSSQTPLPRRIAVGALLLALAVGTRSIGAILLPAIVIHDVWRNRRVRVIAWGAVALAVPLFLMTRSASGYLTMLHGVNWMTIRRNLIQLPLATGGIFGGGIAVAAILIALAAAGLYPIARDKKPLWIVFAAFYLAVLVVWPFSDPERFLIPVLPLLGVGIARTLARVPRLAPLALALVFAREASLYPSTTDGGVGLNYPSTLALYDAVRRDTTDESRVAFRKSRSLSLFTGRRSFLYPVLAPQVISADFCQARITHVAAAPLLFEDDQTYLQPWIDANANYLTLVFRNADYKLYRLAPAWCGSLGL